MRRASFDEALISGPPRRPVLESEAFHELEFRASGGMRRDCFCGMLKDSAVRCAAGIGELEVLHMYQLLVYQLPVTSVSVTSYQCISYQCISYQLPVYQLPVTSYQLPVYQLPEFQFIVHSYELPVKSEKLLFLTGHWPLVTGD